MWTAPFLMGVVTGMLSGFGVGGGTILLIYLTCFAGMEQHLAQGINLIYFLPTAIPAVAAHWKNAYIEKEAFCLSVIGGLLSAAAAAWIASGLDTGLLRRFFGAFLVWVGVRQLRSHVKKL